MADFHDVAVELADQLSDLAKGAWDVGHLDPQLHESPAAHHAALENRREGHHVDVSTAEDRRDPLILKPALVPEDRSDTRCARTLHDGFLDLCKQKNRLLDVPFAHENEIVHVAPNQLYGELARGLDGDAIGNGVVIGNITWIEAVKRMMGRWIALALHADDLDLGNQSLGCDRDTRNQSAPADRHQKSIDTIDGFEHLERQRPLACDDRQVVVRMNERQAALAREVLGEGSRFIEVNTVEDDLSAVRAGLLHLGVGRGTRHDDGRRDAEAPSMISQRLCVVACGHSDHTLLALRRSQAQQAVERPTFLERCGVLSVFVLEVELDAGDRRQRFRELERGAHDVRRNAFVSGADIVDGNRHGEDRQLGESAVYSQPMATA